MEASSRFLIGIDLGTTNSAVAYVDTAEKPPRGAPPPVRVFEVEQLVAEGEVRALASLPSFLYFADEAEAAQGGATLPWESGPQETFVGVLARERGALVPGRQVASAKSWLCLPTVDRTADILPWGAEQSDRACSPVAAAARYLKHLRDAWNHSMAEGGATEGLRFERQALVLTVPASFDEEARELTVEAAREAGLDNLTLLEEPLAAFYAWIAAQKGGLKRQLKDGQLVLVCDVGGGTTDFSLIRVRVEGKEVRFERTAIGEHLLLGGDNVDLALARRVEEKLGRPRLSVRQQNALRRQCCAAKERLLGEPAAESAPVTVLGGGRSVVGGALSAELTRAEVEEVLSEGFLPLNEPDDLPAGDRRTGLRELGLPYASEPAITKHLAAFLTQAAVAMSAGHSDAADVADAEPHGRMARPDAVLFNGGFFHPPLARERVVAAVAGWFPEQGKRWRPKVLNNETPETAVAVGAAYYARVRHGGGGVRISGGSARGYYIGVQQSGQGDGAGRLTAVCVLPRGTEEGTRLELGEREFTALTNRPVSFTLYSTTTRQDEQGAVVRLGEDEMHRHAPLITVLRYGKRSRHIELDVRLTAHFTEVGTLELWCEAPKTGHRWRLQFQLRGAEALEEGAAAEEEETPAVNEGTQVIIPDEAVGEAEKLIRAVFGGPRDALEGETLSPEALPGRLESALGYRKDAWRTETIRKLCDVLAELPAGRKKGRNYEARWLNLFGFCLRPGFGALLDDWRIARARKVYHEGLCFEKDVQCQVEWLILWQRVAGGMNAGQQLEMYERHKSLLGVGGRKAKGRINRQVEREGMLLLASLEHLPPALRVELGEEMLGRIEEEPGNKSYTWALGRLGARVPFYGPLNCVVPAGAAARWAAALLALPELTPAVATAVAQLAARTDDPLRDVEPEFRQEVVRRFEAAGVGGELLEGLQTYVPPSRAAAARIFGESLPEGLRLLG